MKNNQMMAATLPTTQDLFHTFASRQEAAEKLADAVAGWLREAIHTRGRASLVVSGGSTPKPFLETLGKMDLPWDKIYVTLADERWVSPESEDSNEKLVRAHIERLVHFVSLKNAAETPAEGVAFAEAVLEDLMPFDVVVLGMGEDGHTASLFPNHHGLEEGLREDTHHLCLGIENSPKPPSSRLTLTYSALTDCQRLVLHITGKDKLQLFEKAKQNGLAIELPIRAFIHQERIPMEVFWAE